MQYTFTPDELRGLLAQTLELFCEQDGVYDFSEEAGMSITTDTIMHNLELSYDAMPAIDNRLENSLPYLDEEYNDTIPFLGEPVELEDNISEAELGLMPPL